MSKCDPNTTTLFHSPHIERTLFLTAEFRRHRFEPHFHEDYAIGVIDDGCQAFTYDGGRRLDMPTGSVALIAPGIVHDGWSDREGGWRYRMLYPSNDLLKAAVEDAFGPGALATFHKPVVQDDHLFRLLDRLHSVAAEPHADALETQSLLAVIVTRAFSSHAGREAPRAGPRDEGTLVTTRDLIETRHSESLSLGELSDAAGLSRFQLLRHFRAAYGLSPHAYLRLTRVNRARAAIMTGAPLADVAARVGFADQAHMTRSFRKAVGYTPGALRTAFET